MNDMQMWRELVVIAISVIAVQSVCDVPLRFYRDIGCYAIAGSTSSDDCPQQFLCDHINPERHACFYKGRYYDPETHEVVRYVDAPSCEAGNCRCQDDLNFMCEAVSAPYIPLPDYDDCYYTYSLEQCQATGFKCKSNSTNLFECHVNEQIYYDGQIFVPPDPLECKTCVCNPNFRGRFDESVCNPVACPMELWKSRSVQNFCAPVYFTPNDCCPSDFYCPTMEDERSLKTFHGRDDDRRCRFGKSLFLRFGTKISRSSTVDGDKTTTTCECRVPPFLTCYRHFEHVGSSSNHRRGSGRWRNHFRTMHDKFDFK